MEKFKILVLDEDKDLIGEICAFFQSLQFDCEGYTSTRKGLDMLDIKHFDIVITELIMDEMSGLDVIDIIRVNHPNTAVIAIAGFVELHSVIEVFRAGAKDFFVKPISFRELKNGVERVLSQNQDQWHGQNAEPMYSLVSKELREESGIEIVGSSAAMFKVVKLVSMVAKSNGTTVLITGESGTGKELVARAIHVLSERKNKHFHSVNCSAIPESLFESEFFGFSKGAFTGADENTSGWFEVSHKSTLFLDEIAELPLHMQAKFLRVLDNKMINKIGTKKEISLDLRIIAATNQKLHEMVECGKFRIDLFHRLNAFVINIPPLRSRKEDIPELIHYYVKFFNRQLNKHICKVDEKVIEKLLKYDFPGNIRELRNTIEQAMILCQGHSLRVAHLIMDRKVDVMEIRMGDHQEFKLDEVEKYTICKALQRVSYNKSKASRLLNISRQALDRKIKRHRIKVKPKNA